MAMQFSMASKVLVGPAVRGHPTVGVSGRI
jgi:hypothetical protein